MVFQINIRLGRFEKSSTWSRSLFKCNDILSSNKTRSSSDRTSSENQRMNDSFDVVRLVFRLEFRRNQQSRPFASHIYSWCWWKCCFCFDQRFVRRKSTNDKFFIEFQMDFNEQILRINQRKWINTSSISVTTTRWKTSRLFHWKNFFLFLFVFQRFRFSLRKWSTFITHQCVD